MALIRTAGKIISEINKSHLQLASSRCLSEDRTSSFSLVRASPKWNATPERKYSTKGRPRSKSWIAGYFSSDKEPSDEPHKVGPKVDRPSWIDFFVSKVTGGQSSRSPSLPPPPIQCAEKERLDKEMIAAAKEAVKVAEKCMTFPGRAVVVERQPRPPPQPKPPNSAQQVTKDPQYRMPCAPCTPSSAKCTGVLDFSTKIPYSEMRPSTPTRKPACQPCEIPRAVKIGCTSPKSRLSVEIRCHSRKSRQTSNIDESKKSFHTDFKKMSSTVYFNQGFDSEKSQTAPETYLTTTNLMGLQRGERERTGRSSSPTRFISGCQQRSYSNRSQSLPNVDGRKVILREAPTTKDTPGKKPTAYSNVTVRSPAVVKNAPVKVHDKGKSPNVLDMAAKMASNFQKPKQSDAVTKFGPGEKTKAAQSRQNIIDVHNIMAKKRLSVTVAQEAAVSENNKLKKREIDIAPKPYKADPISRNAIDENTVKLQVQTKHRIDSIRRSTDRDDETKILQIQSLRAQDLARRPKSAPEIGGEKKNKIGLGKILGFQKDRSSENQVGNLTQIAALVLKTKSENTTKAGNQSEKKAETKSSRRKIVNTTQKKIEPVSDKLPSSGVQPKKTTSLPSLTDKRPVKNIKDMISRQFSQVQVANLKSEKETPKNDVVASGRSKIKRNQSTLPVAVKDVAPLKPIDHINKNHFTRLKEIFVGERKIGPLKAVENTDEKKKTATKDSSAKQIVPPNNNPEASSAKDSEMIKFKSMKITPFEFKRATTFQPRVSANFVNEKRGVNVMPEDQSTQNKTIDRFRAIEESEPNITDAQKKMIKQIQKRIQTVHLNQINTHVDQDGKVVLVDGKHIMQYGRNLNRYFSSRAETSSPSNCDPSDEIPATRVRSSEIPPRVSSSSVRRVNNSTLKRSFSDSAFRRLELGAGSKGSRRFSKASDDDRTLKDSQAESQHGATKKVPPIPSFSDYIASRNNKSLPINILAAKQKSASTSRSLATAKINPDPLPNNKELGAWYFNVKRKDKFCLAGRNPVVDNKQTELVDESKGSTLDEQLPRKAYENKRIAWALDPSYGSLYAKNERAAHKTEKLIDAANAVRKHAQFVSKKPRGSYSFPLRQQPTHVDLAVTRAEFDKKANSKSKVSDRPQKSVKLAFAKRPPSDPYNQSAPRLGDSAPYKEEAFPKRVDSAPCEKMLKTPARKKERPVFKEVFDDAIFDLPKIPLERKKCGPSLMVVDKIIEKDTMQCMWNPFAKKDAPKNNNGKGKDKNPNDPKKSGGSKNKGDSCKKKEDSSKKKEDPPKKKEGTCTKKEDQSKKKGDPCKKKEDPCKKKEDPCQKKEDPCKKKEDPCKKKEDPCKKKEDPCKKKEDPCKKKEDPCKKKEDPCKKKEDPCKKKEDPCKKKEDPCKKKEDPCKKKEDPCKKKEDPCKKKEDPCKKKEDPCKKKEDPCKKKEDPCKKKEDPCKKKEDPCKKKEDPCKKKEDPCKKKEDPCKKKEDPCKKKEDPCKKKEDPCQKKEDPCKTKVGACKMREEPSKTKEDPCKKKEDPCKKKEDPSKKKEDPCKKKEDPCKKKDDPCKKKEDPCKKKEDPGKKKEDPCKKKEDPCKKKDDPCKKKEDPCKKKEDPSKKKEDPCKKKEDPCKKKDDPCKKKEDPCKKKDNSQKESPSYPLINDPCADCGKKDNKKDECKKDDGKKDPCKKGDAKKDPCKKDDQKKDPCKKDDAKKDPCKKKEEEDCRKIVTKKISPSCDGSGAAKKDDGKKNTCKKDDGKKDSCKKDDAKKDPCKKNDGKKDPCKKDDGKKDSGKKDPCSDEPKEGDQCKIDKPPRKGPSCNDKGGKSCAGDEGRSGGQCQIGEGPSKLPLLDGGDNVGKCAIDLADPEMALNTKNASEIVLSPNNGGFTQTFQDWLHEEPGEFVQPSKEYRPEEPEILFPSATEEFSQTLKDFRPKDPGGKISLLTGELQLPQTSQDFRLEKPKILLPPATEGFSQTLEDFPSEDAEGKISLSTGELQLPQTSQDFGLEEPKILLPPATEGFSQTLKDFPSEDAEGKISLSTDELQLPQTSQDFGLEEPKIFQPPATEGFSQTLKDFRFEDPEGKISLPTGDLQLPQISQDFRLEEPKPLLPPATEEFSKTLHEDPEDPEGKLSPPTGELKLPKTFQDFRAAQPKTLLSPSTERFPHILKDFRIEDPENVLPPITSGLDCPQSLRKFQPEDSEILLPPITGGFPQTLQDCRPEDDLDVIVIKSPKRTSSEETKPRSYLGLNDLGSFCTPTKDPFYNPPGHHLNMDVENIELTPKRAEPASLSTKLELSTLLAMNQQPTLSRRSETSSSPVPDTAKNLSRSTAMLNQNQTRDFSYKADLTSEEMRIIYEQNAIVKANMDTSLQHHLNNVLSTLSRLVVGDNKQTKIQHLKKQEVPLADKKVEYGVGDASNEAVNKHVQESNVQRDNRTGDECPATKVGGRSSEKEHGSSPIFAMPRLIPEPH